ncbi:L,D-transpeptidase [Paraliomyxa miuraensis]|uniref:L,D-transpeptidase n=1 Tax=Paraliomyxa miuraensis TaxID=376150 RepID=UPI002254E42E|nr:L,D-transpeptidase [Paraliomyxa miuraensis]MCX4245611.1 L,D-transpeptidase [Paraliomyxa miuraensis]
MSVLGPLLLAQTVRALMATEPSGEPDDVTVRPTEVRFVEARQLETVVRGRPWVPHKRVATVSKGTRFVVRGEVDSRDDEGCHGKVWYAVWPFGYLCSEHVRTSERPPDVGTALPVPEGKRLPVAYAIVRTEGAPSYASIEDAQADVPEQALTHGMSLVIARGIDVGAQSFVQTAEGKLVRREDVGYMGQGSAWRGVDIEAERTGPLLGWTRQTKTAVRSTPSREAPVIRTVGRRERVPLLEPDAAIRPLWWRVGEDAWIEADDLNEVHVVEPPPGVLSEFRLAAGNDQWFDVDVGEQVIVAYRGTSPQHATLVSSGRGSPTPLGNYPVWAKVAIMDMANQEYEDKPYMVQGVPWVMLFQGHNALHGAYWHDGFGKRRSHGCVNLAPLDARWMFEWAGPSLPEGWTGYLPSELGRSPVVHVRDSSQPPGSTFTQQRPIGPPDREAERAKAEAAAERRAALADALPEVSADAAERWEGRADGTVPRVEAPPSPPLRPHGG